MLEVDDVAIIIGGVDVLECIRWVARVVVYGAVGKEEVLSAYGEKDVDGSASTCAFNGYRGVGLTFRVGVGDDVVAHVASQFNDTPSTETKRIFSSASFNCRETWMA
jgi:hypothetical protein